MDGKDKLVQATSQNPVLLEEKITISPKAEQIPVGSITNRAAELRAKIMEEEAAKAALNIEITTEGVQKLWKQYCDNHTSKSLQTALNTTVVELHDNAIIAYTPTNYIKELIAHEGKLMEEIRSSLHKDDLILNVKVDLSKFPDYQETSAVKTRLSNKEIFQVMAEKNPLLPELMTRLKLRLDGESRILLTLLQIVELLIVASSCGANILYSTSQ